jgi:flagellar protein FlaG
MTFEIGQLTFQTPSPAQPARVWASAGAADAATATAPAAYGAYADIVPASPPPEVLSEVDAAWDRASQLASQGRELHFSTDEVSGRVIIEVRTMDGEVLRTIPPSQALDVISGGEL